MNNTIIKKDDLGSFDVLPLKDTPQKTTPQKTTPQKTTPQKEDIEALQQTTLTLQR